MNVIFLTISRITDVRGRGIYTDLMRKFRDEGHSVYIVCPYERQYHRPTSLTLQDGINLLGVKTLNVQKTNVVEKGIGTVLLETQFKQAIRHYLSGLSFDMILYSTPPITFTNVVKYLKKKNPKAISYLLLKDIFPQNAVDLQMFSKNSLFYGYFRKKEINLYKQSDYIGCMSPANVEFVLKHNAFISPDRVEVAPNSIELVPQQKCVDRLDIRKKYHLPTDKPNGAASREVKSFRHQPGGKPREKRRKALGASPKPGRREDDAHSPGIQANTSYIVPACFAALGSRLRTARHDASYTLRMDRTVCRHANKKVNEAPCYVGFFPNNPYLCSRKQNRYYSL